MKETLIFVPVSKPFTSLDVAVALRVSKSLIFQPTQQIHIKFTSLSKALLLALTCGVIFTVFALIQVHFASESSKMPRNL